MKTTLLSLSLVFALAGAGAAVAQDQTPAQGGQMQGGQMQGGQMQGGQMQGPGGNRGAFRAACGADIQNFCGAAQSRDGRHACIEANRDKFSDSCKSFMASRHHGGQMQGPPGQQ